MRSSSSLITIVVITLFHSTPGLVMADCARANLVSTSFIVVQSLTAIICTKMEQEAHHQVGLGKTRAA